MCEYEITDEKLNDALQFIEKSTFEEFLSLLPEEEIGGSQMRHMKQARRIDNGELVQGYYCKRLLGCMENKYRKADMIQTMPTDDHIQWIEVDPATVEDVAVRPIWEHYCWRCPNCKAAYSSGTVKYCADCGQRIDWSD